MPTDLPTDDELILGLRDGLSSVAAEVPMSLSVSDVRRLGRRRRRTSLGLAGGVVGLGLAAIAGVVAVVQSSSSPHATLVVAPTVAPQLQDATALVGSWKVVGAAGEKPGAVLDLGEQAVLYRRCGEVFGSWTATPAGLMLVSDGGESTACYQQTHTESVPWLLAVAGFRINADGSRTLLSSVGAPVATLLPGGNPGVRKDFLRTAPVLTPALSKLLVDGPDLPAGVRPATVADLAGRWGPDPSDPDAGTHQPYVTFLADGTVKGSDGCNGIGGRWRVGPAGSWLSEGGISTLVGCRGIRELGPSQFVRHVGHDGSTLTFYDTTGKVVERLARTTVAVDLPGGTQVALRGIASAAAQADGGGVYQAQAVKSTLSKALGAVAGQLAPAGSKADPVWVIEVTGNFRCLSCDEPLYRGPPRGTVLTLVVDAGDYASDFSGIANKAIDLSQLGSVMGLTPGG